MNRDALRRARRTIQARSGSVWLLHLLAALQAFLLLALIATVGMLIALAATRGTTRLTGRELESAQARLPGWLEDQLPTPPRDAQGQPLAPPPGLIVTVPDTGLYPLVPTGKSSPNVLHRLASDVLDLAIRIFRPLRDNLSAVVSLVMLGLLLLLAWNAVSRLRRRLAISEVSLALESVRNQIHRQMYRLGQSYLPAEGVGSVLNIFTRDVNELRDGLLADLFHRVHAPILGVGLLLIALAISPSLTLFILALGGLVWLAAGPLIRSRRDEASAAARSSAIHLLQLHEDLSMLRTVRVFGMETVDQKRFEEHLELFQAADRRRLDAESQVHPSLWLTLGAALLLSVGMLAYGVLTGRVSVHGALLLAGVLTALAWPVRDWLERRTALSAGSRAAAGIEDYMERRPELQMNVGAKFLPPIREQISIDRVHLEGPGGRPLLAGASFKIPARTRVAILSLDEDAQHALACLVPRLIDPKSGRVRIDGTDLREVTLESLRAQVAMLLQADYVFSDSVLNNIGLGDPSYGLARIIDAAKSAHAHHFIQQLPQGYDTVIGPLGHTLSLEEQYRVALARAFLHDPSIVIIEEPNITLDDDIKHLIDDSIDRLAKNRTLIFLPHRLSTIRKCDQVVVLHNGKVEAAGPPREIHTQSKLYRHIQYVEFNQFASGEIEAGQLG